MYFKSKEYRLICRLDLLAEWVSRKLGNKEISRVVNNCFSEIKNVVYEECERKNANDK